MLQAYCGGLLGANLVFDCVLDGDEVSLFVVALFLHKECPPSPGLAEESAPVEVTRQVLLLLLLPHKVHPVDPSVNYPPHQTEVVEFDGLMHVLFRCLSGQGVPSPEEGAQPKPDRFSFYFVGEQHHLPSLHNGQLKAVSLDGSVGSDPLVQLLVGLECQSLQVLEAALGSLAQEFLTEMLCFEFPSVLPQFVLLVQLDVHEVEVQFPLSGPLQESNLIPTKVKTTNQVSYKVYSNPLVPQFQQICHPVFGVVVLNLVQVVIVQELRLPDLLPENLVQDVRLDSLVKRGLRQIPILLRSRLHVVMEVASKQEIPRRVVQSLLGYYRCWLMDWTLSLTNRLRSLNTFMWKVVGQLVLTVLYSILFSLGVGFVDLGFHGLLQKAIQFLVDLLFGYGVFLRQWASLDKCLVEGEALEFWIYFTPATYHPTLPQFVELFLQIVLIECVVPFLPEPNPRVGQFQRHGVIGEPPQLRLLILPLQCIYSLLWSLRLFLQQILERKVNVLNGWDCNVRLGEIVESKHPHTVLNQSSLLDRLVKNGGGLGLQHGPATTVFPPGLAHPILQQDPNLMEKEAQRDPQMQSNAPWPSSTRVTHKTHHFKKFQRGRRVLQQNVNTSNRVQTLFESLMKMISTNRDLSLAIQHKKTFCKDQNLPRILDHRNRQSNQNQDETLQKLAGMVVGLSEYNQKLIRRPTIALNPSKPTKSLNTSSELRPLVTSPNNYKESLTDFISQKERSRHRVKPLAKQCSNHSPGESVPQSLVVMLRHRGRTGDNVFEI